MADRGGRDGGERIEASCVRPAAPEATTERLRTAAAMAHVVPGLELTLWARGEPVLVLGGPVGRGHVDPCTFRSMVLGSMPGILAEVDDVTAGGAAVRTAGGDVVASRVGAERRWWWPTRVAPGRLEEVLVGATDELVHRGEVAPDLVAAAAARVTPDPALGVSVVGLTAPVSRTDETAAGDLVAAASWRACVVAELLG